MNKVKSFNLVTQPWINTDLGYKSLIDIFSDRSIKQINENPIFFISIFKLCLSIFQAAYTPKDAFELKELTLEDMSNKAISYLRKWQHKFDLYGDEPFLQSKALFDYSGFIKQKDLRTIPIFIDYIAAGNNVVVRDLNRQNGIDDVICAKTIVALQICSLTGKRIFNGLCLKEQDGKSILSSCPKVSRRTSPFAMNGVIYSFFQGSNVLESLFLNLYTHQDIKETNFPKGLGIPVWEQDILSSDGKKAKDYQDSYHSRLVPMLRFSCLLGDEHNSIIVIDGLNYDGIVDFNVAYKLKKESSNEATESKSEDLSVTKQAKKANSNKIFLTSSIHKGIWTELNSILTFSKLDNDNFKCRHFDICCKNIKMYGYERFKLWTGCIFYSEKSGEQKISGNNDLISSQFEFDIDILSNEDFYQNYANCMNLLNEREKNLVNQIALFFSKDVTIDSKKLSLSKIDKKSSIVAASKVKASHMFWAKAISLKETIIKACITQKDFDEQKAKIQKQVNAIVFNVYDNLCQSYISKEHVYIKSVLCRPILEDILK